MLAHKTSADHYSRHSRPGATYNMRRASACAPVWPTSFLRHRRAGTSHRCMLPSAHPDTCEYGLVLAAQLQQQSLAGACARPWAEQVRPQPEQVRPRPSKGTGVYQTRVRANQVHAALVQACAAHQAVQVLQVPRQARHPVVVREGCHKRLGKHPARQPLSASSPPPWKVTKPTSHTGCAKAATARRAPVQLGGVQRARVLHRLLKGVQRGVQVLVHLLQVLTALARALRLAAVDGLHLHAARGADGEHASRCTTAQ